VVLFPVSELQTRSLAQDQDCIVDHMVRVLVQEVHHMVVLDLVHHMDWDQRILKSIQAMLLDTFVLGREVLRKDNPDHELAWEAVQEDQ